MYISLTQRIENHLICPKIYKKSLDYKTLHVSSGQAARIPSLSKINVVCFLRFTLATVHDDGWVAWDFLLSQITLLFHYMTFQLLTFHEKIR